MKAEHSIADEEVETANSGSVAAKWTDPMRGDDAAMAQLAQGRLRNPFAVLGQHLVEGRTVVRSFQPGALAVEVLGLQTGCNDEDQPLLGRLEKVGVDGLFAGVIDDLRDNGRYLLRISWPRPDGSTVLQYTEDPYAFHALLSDLDLHLFGEGRHYRLGYCLGAQPVVIGGVHGTRFAVWAPNARRVSVVGDFNCWDERRHPMRLRQGAGIWELFIPRVWSGTRYQFDVIGADGSHLPRRSDPVARATEVPPSTISVVADAEEFRWTDQQWMAQRAACNHPSAPMSIYEVHALSWRRPPGKDSRSMNWDELGDALIPYVRGMGFTHIELMPVMEHPFGGSWGYQPLNLFAPTARLGSPASFARFVDRCHAAGIGVLLDWVPAHFPNDTHGLVRFDGTALYEHEDPREGYHQDWNTLIYNVGRNEVRGFLINSALEWLERYHVDGLRVDAVSSMLYRDYSRKPGEWIPNIHGGRENLEAVAFLRQLNQVVAERCPGAVIIAEESTTWPGVSAPVEQGGLGFSYKWNMGWMHDTLHYMATDPLLRCHRHTHVTFGLTYAFSERAVLPVSHDEVVHGKGSLLHKMPGDIAQKLANLRAFFGLMWTYPGKKLLFMGSEFGQHREWNHDAQLQWELLDDPRHQGIQQLLRDLNRVYVHEPALHTGDCDSGGFSWVVVDDQPQSVFVFLRRSTTSAAPPLLVACNFTPVPRFGYRVGVPSCHPERSLRWRELLNSDSALYGGSNLGNLGEVWSSPEASHGYPASLLLTLPPLSVTILKQMDETNAV